MIVYQASKTTFLEDSRDLGIEYAIARAFLRQTGRYAPEAELRAWRGSLREMARVLTDEGIPSDTGVGIEFGIPQTSKRIDFLLSGKSADETPQLIIVELKQWSSSTLSDKDGIIIAQRGGAFEREGPHPSYQAWSYAALLEGFNEAVHEGGVHLQPCAYLHNHPDDGIINHPHYDPYLEKAPLFMRGDAERVRLQAFIRLHLRRGDRAELLVQIENGRIRPSKMLADSMVRMLKGSREFVLVDDQKVVYESALALARKSTPERKQVAIVKGGPGTGKSVVAINLLVELTRQGLMTKYVSKNAAPRSVYKEKLRGEARRVVIDNLFSGSGAFVHTEAGTFDVLVVDEAHRLNQLSGMYGNLGENQVKELLTSANCTVFFVDDDQIVTLNDIGHTTELQRWAQALGCDITCLELSSQFRCNGSDGYLAWLDEILGLRSSANSNFDRDSFDFQVFESPAALHAVIEKKNRAANKARMVAGYCWNWKSKNNPAEYDIEIPEHGYRKRWNLDKDGSLWIIAPHSIDEVGCIHTCQGLELDYVGVIIGPDLVFRDGEIIAVPEARSSQDRTIRGWKKLMRTDPERTKERIDRIVRNTYRTLMTRGMKGCYVYCCDPALGTHLSDLLANPSLRNANLSGDNE